VRWGTPEPSEIDQYEAVNIEGTSIYVHRTVKGTANARIDVVTGGVGTKLILLGFAGNR
jgi:hypothetical protein